MRKYALIGIILAFVLSLIPMLLITRFAHPGGDDFAFGHIAVHTWRDTGSFWQTLQRAFEGTADVYASWQGTFVAVFFMILHPGIFSLGLYQFGLVAVILGLVAATAFFLKVVLRDFFGADWLSFGAIFSLILFFKTQFLISPAEGFFWYNGAMFYTGFHALSLVLFALIFLSFKRGKKIIFCVLVPILAFLVGGGNFVTALTSAVILGVICAGVFLRGKKNRLVPLLGLGGICASLLISVLAPGNNLRQEYFDSMNPLVSIVMSFFYGAFFGLNNTRVLFLPALFVFCAVFWGIAKKAEFSFKYPALATFIFFGVYASTFTPNLYAWSTFGPARALNVSFFAWVLFLFFTSAYWLGWAAKKYESAPWQTLFSPAKIAACVAIFLTGNAFLALANPQSLTGASAAQSLFSREARDFHEQNLARLLHLQNPAVADAVLLPLAATPHVLFLEDITGDPDDWRNSSIAIFFNKNSVRLMENAVEISVEINGSPLDFAAQRPFYDGLIFAPVRDVFEALGFYVGWRAETQEISITNADFAVYFSLGNQTILLNGTTLSLPSPPISINGSTVIPIEKLLESMGFFTTWDSGKLRITTS